MSVACPSSLVKTYVATSVIDISAATPNMGIAQMAIAVNCFFM
jgi:hypothetical protein